MEFRTTLIALVFFGCAPVKWPTEEDSGDTPTRSKGGDADVDADSDTDTDTDSDTDTDTDTDTDFDPGVSPEITWADAFCYHHDVGVEYYQWECAATADDPQGIFTLEYYGTITVFNSSGSQVATYALGCNLETGECHGSFHDYDDAVICTAASSYTIRFEVTDEDGNVSPPYEVRGRQTG